MGYETIGTGAARIVASIRQGQLCVKSRKVRQMSKKWRIVLVRNPTQRGAADVTELMREDSKEPHQDGPSAANDLQSFTISYYNLSIFGLYIDGR